MDRYTFRLPKEGPDAWLFHLSEALLDEFYACENITAAFGALPQLVRHMAIDIELRQGDAAVTAFLDAVQTGVAEARSNHRRAE